MKPNTKLFIANIPFIGTVGSFLITFLLFGLPFLVLPFGASWFETPKVIIAEVVIVLLILVSLTSNRLGFFQNSRKVLESFTVLIRKKRWNKEITSLPVLLCVIFLLSTFHLIFRQSDVSFFGNPFRMQGIFLFLLLIGFAYTVSRIKSWVPSRHFVLVLLCIQLLAVLFGSVTTDGRSVGTLGEPNALASYVVFLWPFLLMGKSSDVGRKKTLAIVAFGIFIALLIIILSGSRSGFIAFCIEVTFFLLIRIGLSVKTSVIFSSMLIVASVLLPFLQTNVVYENRTDIWKASLIAGFEHPFVGFGIGNSEIALKEYNTKLSNNVQGYYVDSSHNFILDWWVQMGIVGLSVLSILFLDAIRGLIKYRKTREVGVLLGIITVMLFNPVSVTTLVCFWWILGKGLASGDVQARS